MTPSPHLYVNRKGVPVKTHSYSGGDTLKFCKRRYKLQRIDGYVERRNLASKQFGIAVESGVKTFHESGMKPSAAVEEFLKHWDRHMEDKTLSYSGKEGSWEQLRQAGTEMMRLYEILAPGLPLDKAKFQLNYRKEVFPGTSLAGIEYTAFIDIHANPARYHPLLSELLPSEVSEASRPLIVDIKTSSLPLDANSALIALDPQLRSYAWVTGVQDVAFLWFVKAKVIPYERGSEVTVLVNEVTTALDGESFRAGDRGVVLTGDENIVWVLSENTYSEYLNEIQGKKRKETEEIRELYAVKATCFKATDVTKQRIQFVTTRLGLEEIREAGEAIGLEITEIVAANDRNSWPKEPGIRFPNNKCQFCPMRGNCLGDKKLRDQLVMRLDEDWLDVLEGAA